MPIHNSDIADMFERIEELLEMKDGNPFRIRAYRNAARTIGSLSKNVAEMVGAGDSLQDLPGIGKDLAGKITEIVETGKFTKLEELQKEIPADILEILRVPGLGPKKVKALYQTLEITSVEDLRTAAREHRIRALSGFGEKTEERILRELDRMSTQDKRISLQTAEEVASSLVGHLRKSKGVHDVAVAGSFRRRKETVGDVDILVTCKKGSRVMARFVDYEDVREVVSHGETRSSVVLRSGLQVDLRVVPQVSYGAAVHYFTGSQAHNIAIRKLGIQRDLKINEYGVYQGKKRIGGKTEQEVYRRVGLPYIEPELREDRGRDPSGTAWEIASVGHRGGYPGKSSFTHHSNRWPPYPGGIGFGCKKAGVRISCHIQSLQARNGGQGLGSKTSCQADRRGGSPKREGKGVPGAQGHRSGHFGGRVAGSSQ